MPYISFPHSSPFTTIWVHCRRHPKTYIPVESCVFLFCLFVTVSSYETTRAVQWSHHLMDEINNWLLFLLLQSFDPGCGHWLLCLLRSENRTPLRVTRCHQIFVEVICALTVRGRNTHTQIDAHSQSFDPGCGYCTSQDQKTARNIGVTGCLRMSSCIDDLGNHTLTVR